MTRYIVTCEDCDFEEVLDDAEPPDHVVNYWGSIEAAREQWHAKSAARGARDNHEMTPYEQGGEFVYHNVEIKVVDK